MQKFEAQTIVARTGIAQPFRRVAAPAGMTARTLEEVLVRVPRGLDPLFAAGRPWLAALARPRLPVRLLRGCIAGGGSASVVAVGEGSLAEMLLDRFFDGEPARETGGSIGVHRLHARLSAHLDDVDLVLAVLPRPCAALAPRAMLRMPTVVEFTIDAASAVALSRARKTLRSDARRARAAGFTTRHTRDPAELAHFYDEFHLPMLARRFGTLGGAKPLTALRRRLRSGGLVWLDYEGKAVAGDLYEIRGDTQRLLVHGRRPLDDPKLDPLVQLAVDLATMEVGHRQGCRTVDMGAAKPVPGSGLFARKRRFGATVRPRASAQYELLIGWRQAGPAVHGFLRRAPLAIRRGDGLEALSALEDTGPADPRVAAKLRSDLLPDGIDRLTVLSAAGWLPARHDSVPGPDAVRLAGPLGSAALAALGSGDG